MSTSNIPALTDVREWLRIPTAYTSDDAMLQNTILPAAFDCIAKHCGDVVPVTYDEFYDGGDFSIWLRNTPVLSVQLMEEGWGFTNYVLDYVQVNAETTADMFAYSIDQPKSGKISRRSGGNVNIPFIPGEGNIHVVYTSGMATMPSKLRIACLELCAFWYEGFLQRSVGTAPSFNAIDDQISRTTAMETYSFGEPYWLVEMLRGYTRTPVIG